MWVDRKQSIRKLFQLILPFSISILWMSAVLANPVLDNVAAGQVNVQQSPGTTVINQSSQQAILNWQSFNINPGESTHFNQPAGGIALNRINPSQGASQIYGSLTATGQIILMNPAGLYFGPSAYVNVGGMIATTANMTDQQFLNSVYQFSKVNGYSGAIINDGQIVAAQHGLIALVAPGVLNNGLIQANLGKVVLGSGNAFTVNFSGDNMINFAIDVPTSTKGINKDGQSLADGIANNGTLFADGGTIILTARSAVGVLDNTINMKGIAQARSIYENQGQIIIDGDTHSGVVNIAGHLDTSGKEAGIKGGNVTITGYNILLDSPSVIDASGDIGGGNVRVGGNYQGKGPLANANAVVMAPGAIINANAITNGNGGEVILWADYLTKFYGHISSTGGSQSGNGALVETSGKIYLEAEGTVNAKAYNGIAGTWLLDPSNVTINNTDANYTTSGVDPLVFVPLTNDVTINIATILASLDAGTSVAIVTNAGSGNQAGDITIAVPITKTAGGDATLFLNATGVLYINNPISSTVGQLSVSIAGGTQVQLAADITTNGGSFQSATPVLVTATTNINLSGGNVNFDTTLDGANQLFINNAGQVTFAGAIGGITPLTNLYMDAGTVNMGANFNGSAVNFQLVNSVFNLTNDVTLTTPSSAFIFPNAVTGAYNLTINGGANFQSTANLASLTVSGLTSLNGSSITTTGIGGINFNSAVTLGNSYVLNSGSGPININSGLSGLGHNLTLQDATANSTGQVTFLGNVQLATLTTFGGASNYIVNLFGTSNTITNAVTFNNLGGVNLGNSTSDVFNFSAGLTSTASTTRLNGIINTTNAPVTLGTTIINSADGQINTTGGNVTLGTVDDLNPGLSYLSIISGAGSINVDTVGGTNPLAFYYLSTDGDLAINHDIITINAYINLNAGNNLTINNASLFSQNFIFLTATAGSITQSGTGILTASELSAQAATGMTLNNNNSMAQIGINNTLSGNVSVTNTIATQLAIDQAGGNFTLNNLGAITQSGAISVSGTSSFSTDGSVITLTNTNNHFTGAVSLNNSGANDVSFRNIDTTILGASTIGGNLAVTVTGTGAVTQTGALNVGGTSIFTLGARALTLSNVGNQFVGAVAITNSGANNVLLYNNTDLIMGNVSVGQNLNLTSSNSISQTGTISAATLTTTSAGGTTLTNGNTISGFNSTNTSSGDIALNNTVATLTITGITQATGTTSITNTGALTTSGTIASNGGSISLATVSPDATERVLTVGAGVQSNGGAINLTAANNSSGSATSLVINNVLNTSPGSGGTFTTSGGIALNIAPIIGSGNITLQAGGLDLNLGTVNFVSSANLTAQRYINITGALTTSGGGNVTLQGDSGNTGTGGVYIAPGATVASSGDLTIIGTSLTGMGGGADPTAAIDIAAGATVSAAGSVNLVGASGNGNININSNVTTSGAQNINVTAAGAGIIKLGAGLSTAGGSLNFNNLVELSGATNLTNAIINFTNGISGNQNMNLTGTTINITGPLTLNNVSITGNGGSNAFTLNTSGNQQWNITGTDTGGLSAITGVGGTFNFSNIQNITGGLGNNNFIFSDNATITGIVNGGNLSSSTTLNYLAYTTDINATLTTINDGTILNAALTPITNYININHLVGNDVNNNAITTPNKTINVVMTGSQQGIIGDPIYFSGFNVLNGTGSAANNTVQFNVPYTNNGGGSVTINGTTMLFNNFTFIVPNTTPVPPVNVANIIQQPTTNANDGANSPLSSTTLIPDYFPQIINDLLATMVLNDDRYFESIIITTGSNCFASGQ